MASTYAYRRRAHAHSSRPLIAFLLIASFGILFAGCGGASDSGLQEEEFRFTEEDVARFRELARDAQDEVDQEGGSDVFVPRLDETEESRGGETEESGPLIVDLSNVETFKTIRSGPGAVGENLYRVTNIFLNVRSEPRVTSAAVTRLRQGDVLELLDFVDAAWARVRLPNDDEGYVSTRYIGKLVSEDKLAEEKKAFDGLYFVDFGFLNVRAEPDTSAEKLGELQGQAIVRPLYMDEVWARVPFNDKEGYIAVEYLSPFLPNLLVRQEDYQVPALHYRLNQTGLTGVLAQHIDHLKTEGYKFITMRDLYNTVLEQQDRDVRIDPNSVLLLISDVTKENAQDVSDVLRVSGVKATLFISTKNIGFDGITEKQIITLQANGFDIQSGGHMGDDLRSLTNSQVDLELKQSRKILEARTGKEVFAIAYPWGGVNGRVMEKTADAGYLFGIGASPQKTFTREKFLEMPSFLISVSMSAADVLALVHGK